MVERTLHYISANYIFCNFYVSHKNFNQFGCETDKNRFIKTALILSVSEFLLFLKCMLKFENPFILYLSQL